MSRDGTCSHWRRVGDRVVHCRRKGTLAYAGAWYCDLHYPPHVVARQQVGQEMRDVGTEMRRVERSLRRQEQRTVAEVAWPQVLLALGLEDGEDATQQAIEKIDYLMELERALEDDGDVD